MAHKQYDSILGKLKEVTDGVPQEALDMELRMTSQLLRLIAKGKPVTVEHLAKAWEIPPEQTAQIVAGARDKLEINEDGHVVGASGLSLRETTYRIHLGGRVMYAWCGMDVLLIASFIGETITAETHDPATRELIALTIAPDGLISYSPEGASLSVYLPSKDGTYDKSGANSVVCLNMPFFASPETAIEWLKRHPSNQLLPITDAYQLVRDLWSDRLDLLTQ